MLAVAILACAPGTLLREDETAGLATHAGDGGHEGWEWSEQGESGAFVRLPIAGFRWSGHAIISPEDRLAAGYLHQCISGAAGKRVRVVAEVRLTDPSGTSKPALYARSVSELQDSEGAHVQVLGGGGWEPLELEFRSPKRSTCIDVGLAVPSGAATALVVRGLRVELRGDSCVGCVDPSPLSPEEVENLAALAETIGIIHYFHPTRAVEEAEWETLTMRLVERVLDARTPEDLAGRLQRLMSPYTRGVLFGTSLADVDRGTPLPAERAKDAVIWHHVGAGDLPFGLYGSRRRRLAEVRVDAGGRAELPVLGDPWVERLSAGVHISVPVALDLPDSRFASSAEDTPEGAQLHDDPEHRTTRLAGVICLWSRLRHFSPYARYLEVDWLQILRTALSSAAVARNRYEYAESLRHMLSSLNDGHAGVTFDDDYSRAQTMPFSWRLGGGGGEAVVSAVERSITGDLLSPGDTVVALNGIPFEEALRREFPFVSGSTPQHRRLKALERLSYGPMQTSVEVRVKRFGDSLVRDAQLQMVPFRRPVSEVPPSEAIVGPGILYVDLVRATRRTLVEDVAPRISSGEIAGLLFDLRGYPKGVYAALELLSGPGARTGPFSVPNTVWPDGEGRWFHELSAPLRAMRESGEALGLPIVVLIDERAMSNAESLADALRVRHNAKIVGSPSAGIRGHLESFSLPGGMSASWTETDCLGELGERTFGVGVEPDELVMQDAGATQRHEDLVFERGLAMVRELAAPVPARRPRTEQPSPENGAPEGAMERPLDGDEDR